MVPHSMGIWEITGPSKDFDQDYKARHPYAPIVQYEGGAWPDFIQWQSPSIPRIGYHETIPPKTRSQAIPQFADWLDITELRTQRLGDNPSDHLVKFYYHWIRGGVDFRRARQRLGRPI
jgi:hypothetical protein